MNIFLVVILVILIAKYLLDVVVEKLNINNLNPELPEEFKDFYDEQKYKKSQRYICENSKFGLIKNTINIVIVISFILFGGFNFLDQIARGFFYGPIFTGLIYIFILILAGYILNLPFSIYKTFVIEEKYGFNKTTVKTFILDMIKSLFLLIIIGGPILAIILWFFQETGKLAPLYIWIIITLFQIFMTFIAPIVFLPLFNKFIPLEEGELRDEINDYVKKQSFQMKGIYKMDGSKRSSKSNAFFTGFGKSRRIVLFDTLIKKHTNDELVGILAHEMGHYKLLHIFKMMVASIFETGLILFVLSFFINNRELFDAFKMNELSIYASLIFFSFLYSPISTFFSIIMNKFSRKYEYEADIFAIKSSKKKMAFISALKRLSTDNLSNLTPHRLKVFFSYTHPPVLKRIQAIRDFKETKDF